MSTKADNILDALFGGGNTEKKTPTLDELLAEAKPAKKKKKAPTLMDEATQTLRFDAPSMQTVAIVAMRIVEKCRCCGKTNQHMNKHLLTKKVDKHGNIHETRFISSSDAINPNIPRLVEQVNTEIAMCEYCFLHGKNIIPVMEPEAKEDIAPNGDTVGRQFKNNQELEDSVDQLWEAIKGMTDE